LVSSLDKNSIYFMKDWNFSQGIGSKMLLGMTQAR
jgi:hypothetical protein